MFQGITDIAQRRDKLMAVRGYQPLKSQMDAGDLTLSILSIFDEGELSGATAFARTLAALGLTRAAAPAINVQELAGFPVQGRKGSTVVLVLPRGTGSHLVGSKLTPLLTPLTARVCSAANRTVADRLAAVNDVSDTLLLKRA